MEQSAYKGLVEKHRGRILEVERRLWAHPETGYREWNTHRYLAGIFENAGYTLQCAGDIPGFYTDLDTGLPGPKVLIMGEMDALLVPGHPEMWAAPSMPADTTPSAPHWWVRPWHSKSRARWTGCAVQSA